MSKTTRQSAAKKTSKANKAPRPEWLEALANDYRCAITLRVGAIIYHLYPTKIEVSKREARGRPLWAARPQEEE